MGQRLPPGDDDYVDVYWYRYWDADLQCMAMSKWMATREAIGARGEPIPETARRVHRSELDGFGRLIVPEGPIH
ncbi:MAG TPA: hypothetical protein VFE23_15280 [Usitatibacter sp.]|jgi:hypothetical protein|nr:hypothetical protein [Usitatibacter sp.]